jgi:hypothetical protein
MIEKRGTTFESLTEPWANINQPQATATLTILSAFAQFDRTFILARTKEGRTVRLETHPTRGKADIALIAKWAEKHKHGLDDSSIRRQSGG